MVGVKKFFFLGVFVVGFFCLAMSVKAEEGATGMTAEEANARHEELTADKEALREQHQEINSSAELARTEEQALREQIVEAQKAGDKEKAKSLKAQWKEMHKANVADRKSDRKALKEARKEMHQDRKEAEDAGYKPKRGKK